MLNIVMAFSSELGLLEVKETVHPGLIVPFVKAKTLEATIRARRINNPFFILNLLVFNVFIIFLI